MTRKLLIIFLTMSLFSCHYISQDQIGETSIRAVVVNPKKGEFYISKDFFQQDADTLHLTDENEVNTVLDSIEEGLYVLYLFPEYQTIYLKPNDSLAMHINVDEFDESLSFSGGLGFENNLLVDLFLINEKQSEAYYKQKWQISQVQLTKLVDSFTTIKKNLLQDYKDDLKETTEKFRQIVALYINSTSYSIKEDFVRRHPEKEFSKAFLAYRNVLKKPIADTRIIDLFNFTDTYLANCMPKDSRKKASFFQDLLKIGKKEIADESFKSAVFSRYCYGYITGKKITSIDETVKQYFEAIHKPKEIAYCKKMIEKNKRLQTKQKFPSIHVKTTDGSVILMDSILLSKNSIVSIWDLYWKKNSSANYKKLLNIKKQFPDIQIVLLNKNYNDFDGWKQTISPDAGFDNYQIVSKNNIDSIMPYSFAQVYFVRNDTIAESMVNLFHVDFDEYLNHFGKKNKKKPTQ